MFSQSYDPFGFGKSLYCGNPYSPRADEKRKRQENARRQRMIEAERRRRAKLERIRRVEEKLKMGDHRRQIEIQVCQLEDEEELRRRRLDVLDSRDDDGVETICPPSFIYAGVSQEELEGNNHSRDSATSPPRSVALKPDEQVTASRHRNKHNTRRRADADLSSICTEEHHQDPDNIDDDETSAPPHIIAVEDDVSDDEEDEDLVSIWIEQAPDSQWIGSNDHIQPYETVE